MRRAWSIALVLAAAPAVAQEHPQEQLDATQQLGQHLFSQSCRVCHAKPQLTSVQYGPVLSRETLGGDVKVMHEVIANGTPRMPGFKYHFQPAQIDAIAAYLKTVPPPATPATPASTPARSRAGAAEAD
jgi:mono/diheme cytochrome c family protein